MEAILIQPLTRAWTNHVPWASASLDRQSIAKLIFQQGLIDIWREVNPTLRNYTHFSNPHGSFARIDHILIASTSIPLTHRAYIKDVVWSDHSMVILVLQRPRGHTPARRWRLKESILSDPIRTKDIETNIRNYFLINDTADTSPSCLWAAHKAVIRGHLIQLASQINKENKTDIEKLDREYTALIKQHKADRNSVPITQLDAARTALNLALTTKAEKWLRWTRNRFYSNGDRIGSMLAGKLFLKFHSPALPKIRIQGGTLSQNPQRIMGEFLTFYKSLYSSGTSPTPEAMDLFLNSIQIPKLEARHRQILDSPISAEEICAVIKNLKSHSAPGPDGFSTPYYKSFSTLLAPYMARFFNALRKGDPLDTSLNTAYITVLPKPDKDTSSVSNYRPISLINNDLKILTKILADRLASFISININKDQVGFIPGRQGPDQIRRAIDIVSLINSNWDGGSSRQGCLLSLDLQKVFDTVQWPYIFNLLQKWGFGDSFLNVIHALYSTPSAQVRLQGFYSNSFPISRGTRQGCPLSPLIFAIAIESLAIAIRNNPNIQGIQSGSRCHKCTLFADDILLFVSSPLTSLPNICRLLDDFGKISGLRVNYNKSQALNINIPDPLLARLRDSFRFSWSDSSISYLGIQLTPKTELLYQANFPPLYKKLEEDLSHWSRLSLTRLGRINTIKMTLLPRILYYFRALPIPVDNTRLKRFQANIVKYIWGKGGHRFSKAILFRPRSGGGLGLPNLLWYLQAAQLAQISTVYSRWEHPDWIHIERQAVPLHTLDFLLWSPKKLRPPILSPTLSHSFALWDRLKSNNRLTSPTTPLQHLFHNPDFPPGLNISDFKWWLDKGMYRIGHLS